MSDWHVTTDVEAFEDAAWSFLLADPVRNTVLLSVGATLLRRGVDIYGTGAPQFGWCRPAGEPVQGAFLRTPPHPALLSGMPTAAAQSLVAMLPTVPAVDGPMPVVTAFADAWTAANGQATEVTARHRLYHLADLTEPQPRPAGAARRAGPADRPVLLDWFSAFAEEADEPMAASPQLVDDRIENGGLLLWEADGVPVSMAGATPPAGGMMRVGPVYTPPELRGRGYAAGVTAEISRRARDAGQEVVLFTDLANPTSNALYQRLGYREVQDYGTVRLGSSGSGSGSGSGSSSGSGSVSGSSSGSHSES
ncbi:MAG: GNAT family N-acetyltransferase [Catenulispora sp.]|nr:GNAT family N-acetyltransferase [Catenulispora sp.]